MPLDNSIKRYLQHYSDSLAVWTAFVANHACQGDKSGSDDTFVFNNNVRLHQADEKSGYNKGLAEQKLAILCIQMYGGMV